MFCTTVHEFPFFVLKFKNLIINIIFLAAMHLKQKLPLNIWSSV